MSSLERMLGVLARLQVARAKELASELGVSQPTVSRLIQEAGERVCRMGQTRATRYARTRSLPRLGTRLPLHRISEAGKVERFGEVHLLEGGRHCISKGEKKRFPKRFGHLSLIDGGSKTINSGLLWRSQLHSPLHGTRTQGEPTV